MATASTKTKSRTTRAKGKKSSPSPKKRPIRREVGGLLCWLFALCVGVSYFGVDALVVKGLKTLFLGLTGYGYFVAALALAWAGTVLLLHQGKPVCLRLTAIFGFPVLWGALRHSMLHGEGSSDSFAWRDILTLWQSGAEGTSGGLLSGAISMGMLELFGQGLSILLLILTLLLAFLVGAKLHPITLWAKIREKHQNRPKYEEETPAIPQKKGKKENAKNIHVPLDDEQPIIEKPQSSLPSFFRRRDARIQTPDELLRGKTVPTGEEPIVPIAEEREQPQKQATVIVEEEPQPLPQRGRTSTPAPLPIEETEPKTEPISKEEISKKEKEAELQAATEAVTQEIETSLGIEGEQRYAYPPLELLEKGKGASLEAGLELQSHSRRLTETLQSFGVDAAPGEVVRGPSVTRFEFVLDQGVKLSKITNLADDIALALGSSGVRIAPIPDKISAVGIEVPNKKVDTVAIRDVLESPAFTKHSSSVAFAVGKDIAGNHIVGNLAKLPHVLIAGTTGSGKSVCTNSLIISMLYKSTPDEVRFIMVDPKMVELAPYNGIPHLLIPVVTDPKKAAGALQWAVFEMMKRYKTFSEWNVKDLQSYNALQGTHPEVKPLPSVVVVIDELADLMLVAAKEVEESICRVAQMGRAAGMHLVIATQRPSADVITGIMKANIPSRIAFAVASSLESRIILDQTGAEKLVGRGDMLYAPLGAGKPTRVQGCLISSEEIEHVVSFVKESGSVEYSEEVMQKIEESLQEREKPAKGSSPAEESDGEADELLPAAVEVVLELKQASVSTLQRRLKLGYARAARIVDQMEERGYVGPFEGSKPRQLLITPEQWERIKNGDSPEENSENEA